MKVCDRCKKQLKSEIDIRAKVIFIKWKSAPDDPIFYPVKYEYELCKDCAKKLKQFVGIKGVLQKFFEKITGGERQ